MLRSNILVGLVHEGRSPHNQVEATTTKRAVVRGQDGPFSQDTSCPEKTGRPVLTAICAIIS